VLLALLCSCAAPPKVEESYVQAIREEWRALGHIQSVLAWYAGTQGETSLNRLSYVGHDRIFLKTALQAIDKAQAAASGNEALALTFLRRQLIGELVGLRVARFDDACDDAEVAATVRLPWRAEPVAFRDVQLLLAQEPDADRRRQAFAAMNAVRAAVLNPILESREAAEQAAAREAGFADIVALAEDQRQVGLDALLASGIAYVKATEVPFRATLDRVAREELGVGREALRHSDWARLWKSPRLAPYFERSFELKSLRAFLGGIGLDLRSAGGTEVKIDDSLNPLKRPRAFVTAVDAPADVRLSVKPAGGLDDTWTLFHEAGHAVHYANAVIEPRELRTQGYGAPTEAFGEFFRQAFSDPRWLLRYREFLKAQGQPVPSNAELAAIARRTALAEMYFLRRYAFAKIAYELCLHGRPASEIAPALALLPAPDKAANDLRELYRQLFSVAYGFELDTEDAQAFRTDVDDGFYAADYARAFVLAGQLHEGIRRRFGEDWYGKPAVGDFLRAQLFAPGTSLSALEVARRLGFDRLDFEAAATRASRLLLEADALEQAK
jgi:hypothetical protein